MATILKSSGSWDSETVLVLSEYLTIVPLNYPTPHSLPCPTLPPPRPVYPVFTVEYSRLFFLQDSSTVPLNLVTTTQHSLKDLCIVSVRHDQFWFTQHLLRSSPHKVQIAELYAQARENHWSIHQHKLVCILFCSVFILMRKISQHKCQLCKNHDSR